jgi:hypothetical protein
MDVDTCGSRTRQLPDPTISPSASTRRAVLSRKDLLEGEALD